MTCSADMGEPIPEQHFRRPSMQQREAITEQPPAIVVIDDDASVRKALDNLFKSVGFAVELFASPQEFLQSDRPDRPGDRKSTRLNSSHSQISYAVFCLK